MGRMLVVIMGICSAIAFLTVLRTLGVIMKVIGKETGGTEGISQMADWWFYVAVLISISGITNAILMSVTERIKEIGTLKCLGSRNIHIVEIFLFESVLLGTLGGVLGAVIGYVAALVNFGAAVGWKYLTAEMALEASANILICIGISAALALLASVIPVLRAARVEPAAAMRYEV